ncbi:MAG: TrlF family AAA-like ATPase, partial [Candidatus Helarchaeota archaeon]
LENSDPKSIAEIGTKQRNGKKRATYLKLSSFSIDAFKIAFHDPQTRVCLYEKPEFSFDRISSIKITGSSFLKDIHIEFNPELNTFIGGRGVGKSAVMESLRYALNLPIYSDSSFRTEFVQDVVGSGGLIEVRIERFFGRKKQEYSTKRIVGKLPEVFDSDGEKREIEPADIFEDKSTPIVLGQKELYHLSLKSEFQLQLIDELIGEAVSKEIQKFNKLLFQLKENAQAILQLKAQLEQKEEYKQKLRTIESQIKTFEKLKVVEKLRTYTDVMEDEKKLYSTKETIEEVFSRFGEIFDDAENELFTLSQALQTGKSKHKDILIQAARGIIQLTQKLSNHNKALTETFKNVESKLKGLYEQWQTLKKPIEADATEIKKKLQVEGLAPGKYDALIQEKLRIEPLVARLEKVEHELTNLLKTRKFLLQQLQKQRYAIFKIRKDQIEQLNQKLAGRIKLEVMFEGEKEKFKEELKSITKGAKIQPSAFDAIVETNQHTIDGIELSSYLDLGTSALQEQFGLTEAQANRIILWFNDDQRRFELERLFPEDKIIIKLKVGEKYEELNKLSAGQKATALLLLLFAQENRILVIDQPEEDLDNRFIYEDVVKILRELKGKKQIILATHNANIPVLGDAEQIIVLDAVEEACKIIHTGSIDVKAIREDVKEIMEGGEEAFQKRAQKYGEID